MTFYQWLRRQHKRDDIVGDLAQDVRRNVRSQYGRGCPEAGYSRNPSSVAGWLQYLEDVMACDGAIEACKQAAAEYSKIKGDQISKKAA
jgi:hypothetical protein